jgi:hypothetical protein
MLQGRQPVELERLSWPWDVFFGSSEGLGPDLVITHQGFDRKGFCTMNRVDKHLTATRLAETPGSVTRHYLEAAERTAALERSELRMGILALVAAATGLVGWIGFAYLLLR